MRPRFCSRTWRRCVRVTGRTKTAYTYGLHGTPTTFTLEARLAEIEDGTYCLLAPSGLAAIAMVDFALLKSGDDVLIPDNVYNPNRELGNWLAQDFGISAPLLRSDDRRRHCRPDPAEYRADLDRSARLGIDGSARYPGDLQGSARRQASWSRSTIPGRPALPFAAFDHGVDIVMQALTKYQSGGSDVLMGAVITRDEALNSARLELAHMRLGLASAWMTPISCLRGLPTMKLRFDAHDRGARKVAAWLKARPEIARVLHPAFDDCPGHEIWKRDFTGAGGLFSVIFDERYSEAQTDRFVDSLKLFKIGFSWGGANSLCVPYRIQAMRKNWRDQDNWCVSILAWKNRRT